MRRFLSVDIGTSSMKMAVFSENLGIVSLDSVEFSPESAHTPYEWVEAFSSLVKKVHSEISSNKLEKLHIVISGHGPSTVYLNKKKEVIDYVSWQNKEYAPIPKEQSYYIPQIEHVRKNHPDVFKNITMVLPPAEYLTFLLCGVSCLFVPNHEYLPYMWSNISIKNYLIPPTILPHPVLTGSLIRQAKSSLSKKLKIEHAVIYAGGLDFISALSGTGALHSHKILQRSGTSVVYNAYFSTLNTTQNTGASSREQFQIPGIRPHTSSIVGYTVPFYDEIYQYLQSIDFLTQYPVKDIINNIQDNRPIISPIVSQLDENIQKNEYKNIEQLLIALKKNTPKEIRKTTLLSLLLHLTQQIYKKTIKASPPPTLQMNPTIIVSGGHAKDEVLMQLQATAFNVHVHTYTPIYTELFGSVFFLLHAEGKTYLEITDKIKPTKKYLPGAFKR